MQVNQLLLMVNPSMTMKYFKRSFCLVAAAFCIKVQANICDVEIAAAPRSNSVHYICDKQNNALFGYDISIKQPIFATYNVRPQAFNGFIKNTGTYPQVPGLEESKQPVYTMGNTVDKAYLVAPYQLIKDERYARSAFAMNNIIPVEKSIWRGKLRELLYDIDLLERDMVSKKGNVTALYGVIGGEIDKAPTHLYRVYYQDQYKLTLSFMIPISSQLEPTIESYITSIDCIEKLGRIDLFPNKPLKEQGDLENGKARSTVIWARLDGMAGGATCNY